MTGGKYMTEINDLKERASNLQAIYVCLCLTNDDDPRREKALNKAKKAYDEICKEIEKCN